jgi:hypothetical protein
MRFVILLKRLRMHVMQQSRDYGVGIWIGIDLDIQLACAVR